jgi:hypothetical protein
MASRMLQLLLSGMFDYALRKIMTAFEERAKALLPAAATGANSGADVSARHART